LEGEPIILAAPEGEKACTEMSVWEDIRLIPDFACVTVPDKIEYPKANYSDFKLVFDEIKEKTNLNKLGIVGIDAMSKYVFDTIRNSVGNVEITDANSLLFELRLTKSENEIKCLKEAARIADEGYIATVNFPFVVGNISDGQKKLINLLVEAEGIALEHLKPNSKQSDLVIAVKGYFAKNNVSEYDLYPPLHGCGMAEAESPYPNENTVGIFKPGMTVNIDLSLFGHPDGSNRIEEGFLVTENGYEPMSNLVRNLISSFLKKLKIVYVKRFSFSPYILS
jgi:Xaa-Pro aminopeptidase